MIERRHIAGIDGPSALPGISSNYMKDLRELNMIAPLVMMLSGIATLGIVSAVLVTKR